MAKETEDPFDRRVPVSSVDPSSSVQESNESQEKPQKTLDRFRSKSRDNRPMSGPVIPRPARRKTGGPRRAFQSQQVLMKSWEVRPEREGRGWTSSLEEEGEAAFADDLDST